jgi:RNA polymerase sigma factor (sigma-70 family)
VHVAPDSSSTLAALLTWWLPRLRRWTHGRLPLWARSAADTSDIVQDVLLRTLRRFDRIDLRGRHAVGAYLREGVRNRIRDERRRVGRHGIGEDLHVEVAEAAPSPLGQLISAENESRYHAALSRLRARDRDLIVAHVELGYTHAQLGCMTGRSSNAARMALQRAVLRLTDEMRRS